MRTLRTRIDERIGGKSRKRLGELVDRHGDTVSALLVDLEGGGSTAAGYPRCRGDQAPRRRLVCGRHSDLRRSEGGLGVEQRSVAQQGCPTSHSVQSRAAVCSIEPHFVLTSPREPEDIDTHNWATWMRSSRIVPMDASTHACETNDRLETTEKGI